MENVTAAFRCQHDMELAAEALRQQGAIDVKLDARTEFSTQSESLLQPNIMSKNAAPHRNVCTMHVVMESSRRSLAQDIIARYGGNVT